MTCGVPTQLRPLQPQATWVGLQLYGEARCTKHDGGRTSVATGTESGCAERYRVPPQAPVRGDHCPPRLAATCRALWLPKETPGCPGPPLVRERHEVNTCSTGTAMCPALGRSPGSVERAKATQEGSTGEELDTLRAKFRDSLYFHQPRPHSFDDSHRCLTRALPSKVPCNSGTASSSVPVEPTTPVAAVPNWAGWGSHRHYAHHTGTSVSLAG